MASPTKSLGIYPSTLAKLSHMDGLQRRTGGCAVRYILLSVPLYIGFVYDPRDNGSPRRGNWIEALAVFSALDGMGELLVWNRDLNARKSRRGPRGSDTFLRRELVSRVRGVWRAMGRRTWSKCMHTRRSGLFRILRPNTRSIRSSHHCSQRSSDRTRFKRASCLPSTRRRATYPNSSDCR